MEKELTNIISCKYIEKLDKYVVELGIKNESKKKVWLSVKQFDNLDYCFSQTDNGYSNKRITIIGVFNDEGYFWYSKVLWNSTKKDFRIPTQYNLQDLEEE